MLQFIASALDAENGVHDIETMFANEDDHDHDLDDVLSD